MAMQQYYGASKKEREKSLGKVRERGGVCLTSYGMIGSNTVDFIGEKGFQWDYVILDEGSLPFKPVFRASYCSAGHKIKNPSTQVSKCLHSIPAKHRIILTGTPIQNSFDEMWALFDFACQGR